VAVRFFNWRAVAGAGLAGVLGCGSAGPRTYPVTAKAELTRGDIALLAGSHVEAALEGDPAVRAFGEIQPDGSAALETFQAGAVFKGAREGHYRVRIVLADEVGSGRRPTARALAPRFLKFETSGLPLQVPAAGDVTLKVAPR
jgi:hypothetical protein